MRPVLFRLPFLDLPVYGYGVMLGLAFVIGWCLMLWFARRRGLPEAPLRTAMVLAAVGAIVGARLLYVATNPDRGWSLVSIVNLRNGGLVAYGGLLGGVGLGWAYLAYRKERLWSYLDVATPPIALGMGLVRIGCFLRGCCYGARTDFITGIPFPPPSLVFEQHRDRHWLTGSEPFTHPVHPTQLYESLFGFSLFALTAWVFLRKSRFNGQTFLTFFGAYALWRFAIEFVRDDAQRGAVGLFSTSQFISLMIGLLSFAAFVWLYRRAGRRGPAAG